MTQKLHIVFLILLMSTLTLGANSLRIESETLKANLKNFKILDTRTNALYTQGHIKGALSFPIELTYENKAKNGKLTNPIKMQTILRKLGLTLNAPIVIYDNGSFFDAARLFWVLEVYGFNNVKLLNMGYDTWSIHNYATNTIIPQVTPSNYIAKVDNKRLATKFTTQIASKNPNQTIIDARPEKAYIGEVSSAVRFGHIPEAINFPASHNISYQKDSSELKTIDNLKELYKNVDKSKKVILYCAIGRISATNYFALRELDYDVANYDASWKEWGNDTTLPIINPSQK